MRCRMVVMDTHTHTITTIHTPHKNSQHTPSHTQNTSYTHTYTHTQTHTYAYPHSHTETQTHTHNHTLHTHTTTHQHTHAPTHTHTHTQSQECEKIAMKVQLQVLRNAKRRLYIVKAMQCPTPNAEADRASATYSQVQITNHIIVCSIKSEWWSTINNIKNTQILTHPNTQHTHTHPHPHKHTQPHTLKHKTLSFSHTNTCN